MSFPRYGEYKKSGVAWLGEIPSHWRLHQARRLFEQRRDASLPGDEQLSATQKYGVIPQRLFMEQEDQKVVLALSGLENFKRLQPDDFVISLRSFQGGIERSRYSGCVSPAYTVLRPNSELVPGFWEYLLKSSLYISALQTTTDGIRDGKNISYGQFGALSVPLAPSDEQAVIAAFLDHETAKIDALIAEQEKLIALLAEKRQATVSHTVTRGLNPQAPMKDSGVQWLGEVPAHWAIKRMKQLVVEGIAGPYGSSLTKEMYTSQGYRVYGQQQVIPGDFSIGDYYISEEKFAEMSRYVVRASDLLVSVMGTIGRAAVVPADAEPGIINPRLVLYRMNRDLVQPNYMQVFLSAPSSQRYFALAAQGTTMEGLNMSSIGALWVAVPPLHEQGDILAFVQAETERLATAAQEVESALGLLKERRAALIAAAVTGQIDVRGFTAA
jgi:type I restriction enzyme S subunit